MDVQFHLRSASDLGVPTNTSGSTRPLMMMKRPIHTIHYTGLRPDQIWFSGGDGVFDSIEAVFQFVKRLEEVARRAGKPFEYNTVIPVMADGSAHVLAYADEYVAAHSSGENTIAHGTLFITGVGQELNDGAILAFQWWNAVLEYSGRLTANSQILPHNQMPGAATACPGPPIIRRLPELRTPYVPQDTLPPPPPPSPIYPGVKDMFFPITPTRMADTRAWPKVPLNANQTYEFGLNPTIVPENAIAAAMNVTIIGGTPGSYLTLWGSGPLPDTSLANFNVGEALVNASYVGPVSNLKFNLRPALSGMHVIIDVTGYWTP